MSPMNISRPAIPSLLVSAPTITVNDCLIYRFVSLIFTLVSVLSFIFNFHSIAHDRHRSNPLAFTLIVNSLMVALASLPYVFVQSIQCHPVGSDFICSLQGFLCFTCGTCVMYTMSLLAIVQYIRFFYNSSLIDRLLKHRHSFLIPMVCCFASLLWSLPPFLNMPPGFSREGQGFDCSLNWTLSDMRSRLYLCLAFAFIYFLPLFCLLFTNIHILIAIRRIIYRRTSLITASNQTMSLDARHRLIDLFTIGESTRLKRLRVDRRFAQATMIIVVHYLLAWTPYALCGFLQMILSMSTVPYQLPPMLPTISALVAKMAVVGQSCVYYYTIRPSNRRFFVTSTSLK